MKTPDSEHISLPTTVQIRVDPDGVWDMCLPAGKHVGGKAANQAEAKEAALAKHTDWLLQQAQRGATIKTATGPQFAVPLT